MASLEIKILAGAESKKFLEDFTSQVDRMEELLAKATTSVATKVASKVTDEDEDDDEEFETATTVASEDDEDEELDDLDDTEDDEEEEAPKKSAKTKTKTKTKKYTIKDVNKACKEKMADTDRKTVLKILKKKFNVASVTELEPDQYSEVIEAMTA